MKKIFLCICILVLLFGCSGNLENEKMKLPSVPQSSEDKKTYDVRVPEKILAFSSVILEFIKDYDINVKIFDNSKLHNVQELSEDDINLILSFKPETIYLDRETNIDVTKLKNIAPIVYIDAEKKDQLDNIKIEYTKLSKVFDVIKLVNYDILDIDTSIRLIEENSTKEELEEFYKFISTDDSGKLMKSLHSYQKRINEYIKIHSRRNDE